MSIPRRRAAGGAALAQIIRDDPEPGSIKRRQMKRAADPRLQHCGGRAFGPSVLRPEPTDDLTLRGPTPEQIKAHGKITKAEVEAIDARIDHIEQRFAASRPGVDTEEAREAAHEVKQLRQIREDLLAERTPEISDHQRRYIAHRARELKTQAERAAETERDPRRARQLRVSAARARHEAMEEAGLRPVTHYR